MKFYRWHSLSFLFWPDAAPIIRRRKRLFPGKKHLPNYVPWKQARRLFNPDHLSMPSVPTLTGSIFIAVIKTDRWKRTITLPS